METVILYTTHCPMCKGVETLLKSKNIEYKEVEGEEPIRQLGFHSAPVLVVDGVSYVGKDIHAWIRNYTKNN